MLSIWLDSRSANYLSRTTIIDWCWLHLCLSKGFSSVIIKFINPSDPFCDSTDSNQIKSTVSEQLTTPLSKVHRNCHQKRLLIASHTQLRSCYLYSYDLLCNSFWTMHEWMTSRFLYITSCSTVLHWFQDWIDPKPSSLHPLKHQSLGDSMYFHVTQILLSLAVSPWGGLAQQALQDRDVELRQCEHPVVLWSSSGLCMCFFGRVKRKWTTEPRPDNAYFFHSPPPCTCVYFRCDSQIWTPEVARATRSCWRAVPKPRVLKPWWLRIYWGSWGMRVEGRKGSAKTS